MKYVKNIGFGAVSVRLRRNPEEEGELVWFIDRRIDRLTDRVEHSGLTPITDDKLQLLQENNSMFNSFIKSGKLAILDTKPVEDMTEAERQAYVEQRIVDLSTQLNTMTAKYNAAVTELEDLRKTLSDNADKTAERKVKKVKE